MGKDELIEMLRDYAIWADANIWNVPIMLPDVLRAAADTIENDQSIFEEFTKRRNSRDE